MLFSVSDTLDFSIGDFGILFLAVLEEASLIIGHYFSSNYLAERTEQIFLLICCSLLKSSGTTLAQTFFTLRYLVKINLKVCLLIPSSEGSTDNHFSPIQLLFPLLD
jgi:hypothetical protein